MKEKIGILFVLALISINLVSAINLEIREEVINEVIMTDLDNPALFELIIKNLGEADTFEIYSLLDVYMLPKGTFSIDQGRTKRIEVEVKAGESLKKKSGYFTFVYKIKGSNTGLQEERLTIKLVDLKQAFYLFSDTITTESEEVTVYLENREDFDFEHIEAEFSSVFFNFEEKFSLKGLETKSFKVDLDEEKSKGLIAGSYILNTDIKIEDAEETLESTIKFLEKSGLSVQEGKEGWIIVRQEIEKKNEGNTVTLTEITMERGIVSRLFTSFSLEPSKIERRGSRVLYTWQQELRPGESLRVAARTNWHVPIIVIIAIIVIIILVRVYLVSDVILKKKINFVKTKGGEFALKVSVSVKARRFVERINVIDKLPPIVKLYERYGTIAPDRVDEKNRRIEWNLESLDEGEERRFSYIVYSKIGVIGKFELPSAKAVYEREGKIKETESNKVFFISEARKVRKVDRGD